MRRLAGQARPYWGHLVVLFLVSFLTTPLTLLNPVPLKLVVDCVLGDDELPGIFHAVLS
jgi:ATP-binding cassette subfamily B protein